ncbi:carboxymuconolactone decarboxylase family protein [Jiangella ureilytica]|uniref:Carboxymuconolactone decarboxylase family protein n=1 Tax=Jiangella ureilytica TaxID=2530374 RepID=A0A4R4RW16_9ACTN|nr:carboxymuconolactone decarboxylase family protein [Jiangella ureilytica]TDC52783.1 carboxymuconolactone decarboxylase family protein [Jiangella ureilytica]
MRSAVKDEHNAEPSPAYGAAKAVKPRSFVDRYEKFRSLDPHFAEVWCQYTGAMLALPALDMRTRLLTLTSMYTMLSDQDGLLDTLAAAVEQRVDLKEVLEAILQCWVYAGEQPVSVAVDVLIEVADAAGQLAGLKARGLPPETGRIGRSLEVERESWSAEDRADPRLSGLLERHGWEGISLGLQQRPGVHLDVLERLERLDVAFTGHWVNTIYRGMYSRGVLDEKTRILCMVADCLATGEIRNGRGHMRWAVLAGATPAEVRDVVLQACAVIGHPHIISTALPALIDVLDELGRLDELSQSDP